MYTIYLTYPHKTKLAYTSVLSHLFVQVRFTLANYSPTSTQD
uniref:Uncharacterized protein n=1 Tax=Arundo donax TaxID=35708 RepID=A0A0A9C3U0_ARUDO